MKKLLLLSLLVTLTFGAKPPDCKRRIAIYHIGECDKPLKCVIFSNRVVYFKKYDSWGKEVIVLNEADFSLIAAAVKSFKYSAPDTLKLGKYGTFTLETDDQCRPKTSVTYNPQASKRLFAYLLTKVKAVAPEKQAGMRKSLLTVSERL